MERMQLAESAEAAGDAAAAHAHYTAAAADLAAAGDEGAAEAARQRAAALAPLRAHEQELAAEDAVTRHDMYQVIAQYIKAGGKPQRAISLLADGFRGHAAMVELMATWLAEASADDSRARGDIEAAAGGVRPRPRPPAAGGEGRLARRTRATLWRRTPMRCPPGRMLAPRFSTPRTPCSPSCFQT